MGNNNNAPKTFLEKIKEMLEQKEQEILNFKEKYGSDDDDNERMKKYQLIIEKREKLYE